MALALTVASVTENLFEGAVESVTVPGAAGEMTILANHEPLISTLKKGAVVIRQRDAESREIPIESGVLEVSGSRAVILV